jgi:hypothetical protein
MLIKVLLVHGYKKPSKCYVLKSYIWFLKQNCVIITYILLKKLKLKKHPKWSILLKNANDNT